MPDRSSIRSLHRRPSLSCDVGGFCFSLCRGQKSNRHLGVSARNCCTKSDSAVHSEANERREQWRYGGGFLSLSSQPCCRRRPAASTPRVPWRPAVGDLSIKRRLRRRPRVEFAFGLST